MRQVGYVVAVKEGLADVAVGEHLECRRCGACMATMGKRRRHFTADNRLGAALGDKVDVETASGFAVAAAFLVYIFPILAGGAGALAGYRLLPGLGLGPAVGAVIGGAASLVASVAVVRHLDRLYFSRQMPTIVSILAQGDSNEGRP
jgi:sigma-E factor negative regulatory protein RseC